MPATWLSQPDINIAREGEQVVEAWKVCKLQSPQDAIASRRGVATSPPNEPRSLKPMSSATISKHIGTLVCMGQTLGERPKNNAKLRSFEQCCKPSTWNHGALPGGRISRGNRQTASFGTGYSIICRLASRLHRLLCYNPRLSVIVPRPFDKLPHFRLKAAAKLPWWNSPEFPHLEALEPREFWRIPLPQEELQHAQLQRVLWH